MITDVLTRTIKCDGPECKNEIVFNPKEQADLKRLQETDWVKDFRVVQRGDQQSFGYCSDVCEVQGVTAAKHNMPEPKAIQPATEADVKAAAVGAAAAAALKTSDASEAGAKVTLE